MRLDAGSVKVQHNLMERTVKTVADIPFVDWNGSGEIDSSDIALTLAMRDSEDDDDED